MVLAKCLLCSLFLLSQSCIGPSHPCGIGACSNMIDQNWTYLKTGFCEVRLYWWEILETPSWYPSELGLVQRRERPTKALSLTPNPFNKCVVRCIHSYQAYNFLWTSHNFSPNLSEPHFQKNFFKLKHHVIHICARAFFPIILHVEINATPIVIRLFSFFIICFCYKHCAPCFAFPISPVAFIV